MIRRASFEDDVTAIRRVAEQAYRIYVKDLGGPPAPMIADFARHIDQDWVIVFQLDDVIAGYAILIDDGERALLDNIAVDPSHQGKGIGRALVDEVERETASRGHGHLELYTNVVMTKNVRWYRTLGFVETKRVIEGGFHRIYMSKHIGRIVDG